MGKLEVNVIPVDEDGESEVQEDNIPEEPEDLIGKRIDFIVDIKQASQLPKNFCRDVYCEYKFFLSDEIYQSTKILGKDQNPQFDYRYHHTIEYCTPGFIEHLKKDSLCIKLFGFPDLDPKEVKTEQRGAERRTKKTMNTSSNNSSMQNRSGYSTQDNTMNSFDSKNNQNDSIEQERQRVEQQRRSQLYLSFQFNYQCQQQMQRQTRPQQENHQIETRGKKHGASGKGGQGEKDKECTIF